MKSSLKYAIPVFILVSAHLFLFPVSLLYGQTLHHCSIDNQHDFIRKPAESFLAYRPIHESIIVTQDRTETISLIPQEEFDISRIHATATYIHGQEERIHESQELSFFDNGQEGDIIPGDNIFMSDDLQLNFEDWVGTYKIRRVELSLTFIDNNSDTIGYENVALNYIIINHNYLNNVEDINIHYLISDSSIVHIGNAVYIEFEKNIKKYIDPDRHFSAHFYDEELWMEDVYDSIWQETFFTFPGDEELGVGNLNSSCYSFPMNGGSGNYYIFGNKTGNTSMHVMFTHSTIVHELFHMFEPHFFHYSIEDPQSPVYQIGEFGHNPVQFFGQSAFGLDYPLPIGYANLCPEHFEALVQTDDGYQITISEPCDITGLNLVDGIPENVHSNFELYLMDLIEVDVLDFPMHFGFNASKQVGEEAVTWTFDTLASLTKEQLINMKEMWYNREGGKYIPFYDAKAKNMLVFFHGSGRRSYNEFKALHLLADELVQETIDISIPDWLQWGYEDDIYHRFISYEQATLGLGRLTNKFPLPPGYLTINCGSNETYSCLSEVPEPYSDFWEFVLDGGIVSGPCSTNAIDSSSFELISDSVTLYCLGAVVTRIYSIADTCDNVAECSQEIIVEIPAPTFTFPALDTIITCEDAINYVAQDIPYSNGLIGECEISGFASVHSVGHSYDICGGNLHNLWEFDTCGRTITLSHSIDVSPAPRANFISPPSDTSMSCEDAQAYDIPELSYTNGLTGICEISGSVPGELSGTFEDCKSQTASWTFTDDCGRTITYTQNVSIETVSVQNLQSNHAFSLDPNPAGTTLRITSLNNESIDKVNFYTTRGNKQYSFQLRTSNLDISSLPSGLYIVQIISKGKMYNMKLIVL